MASTGYINISTRISIRWLPEPATEPTDTLVYNVGNYFLDLRILKKDTSIEWAFAGERQVLSTNPLVCRWIHALDSHPRSPDSTPDEASFTELPNGDELEVGKMACPERGGEITAYEEVWRTLKARRGVGWGWILQGVEGEGKVWVARVGSGFISMWDRRGEGGGFGVRKEEWDDGKGWREIYAIGDVEGLISMVGLGKGEIEEEGEWKVGNQVVVADGRFVVRAWERLEDGK